MHHLQDTTLPTGKLEANPTENLTADELIAMLVDSEWDDRHNRQIERSLRNACFRYKATIEELEIPLAQSKDGGVTAIHY